jgi:hypothetical protein
MTCAVEGAVNLCPYLNPETKLAVGIKEKRPPHEEAVSLLCSHASYQQATALEEATSIPLPTLR